jgi:hypothetical protein
MKTYKKIAAVIKAPRDAGESMPSMAKTKKQKKKKREFVNLQQIRISKNEG